MTIARILVVDDDPQVRAIVESVLLDEGYAVETADDGGEAVDRASRWLPDLLVLDMNLPTLDGLSVAAALRRSLGAAFPIIVISSDRDVADKARKIGALTYLRKPFNLDGLVKAVRRGLPAA